MTFFYDTEIINSKTGKQYVKAIAKKRSSEFTWFDLRIILQSLFDVEENKRYAEYPKFLGGQKLVNFAQDIYEGMSWEDLVIKYKIPRRG